MRTATSSPAIEWANLKYQITSDLAVRLGRIVLPTYDRSDTQNVGYALPWVRVPIEITYTSTATNSRRCRCRCTA
jgi:hypothetical protein